jgi:hypothetical protein
VTSLDHCNRKMYIQVKNDKSSLVEFTIPVQYSNGPERRCPCPNNFGPCSYCAHQVFVSLLFVTITHLLHNFEQVKIECI